MALIQEEIRNFGFKGWQGLLGTGNRTTAPDNLTWYEEQTTNSLGVHPRSVQLEIDQVPPARHQADASANSTALPTIIKDYTTAIHLTPSPNQKAFFATELYGDYTTRLYNFIMPQQVARVDAGFVGMPSIGYAIRFYQGDPNAGGVEIPTTTDSNGADVGWFIMYGAGAVVVSSSFSAITDATDLWITGYQYIGKTALDTASSDIVVDDITIEKLTEFKPVGVENSIDQLVKTNWQPLTTNVYPYVDSVGGQCFCDVQLAHVFTISSATDVWAAGTYEFYSDVDLTLGGTNTTLVGLRDGGTNTSYYFTQTYSAGLYKQTVTLPAGTVISEFDINVSAVGSPVNIWLIDKFSLLPLEDMITNKNIGRIIGANELSIDGDDVFMHGDGDEELVTRNFVQHKILEGDEKTIHREIVTPEVVTPADFNFLLHDAWDETAPTTGFTLGAGCTYDALTGTLTATSGSIFSAVPHHSFVGKVFKFIADVDMSPTQDIYFWDYSNDLGYTSFNKVPLSDGWFLYTMQIPEGQPAAIDILTNHSGGTLNLRFVDMKYYPPFNQFKINEIDYLIDYDNRSLDASNVSSFNSQRELPNKLYVDRHTPQADHITIEETLKFDISDSLTLNLAHQWDNSNLSSTINTGSYLQGVYTGDGTFLLDVDYVSTAWQSGNYRIWISENIPAVDCYIDMDGVQVSSTLNLPFDGGFMCHFFYEREDPVVGHWNLHIQGTSALTVKLMQFQYKNKITIKEIDYIIDSDYESIDGSNTPMLDAHRELVTRDYVDNKNTQNRLYQFSFNGSDMGGTKYKNRGFSTGRFMLRDKSKYTITKNGVLMGAVDWDFLDPIDMSAPNPQGLPTYQATIIINTAYVPADVFVVEYSEEVAPLADYQIKLYRTDSVPLRAYMIPKSCRINDQPVYNLSTTIINQYSVDVTYKEMYSSTTYTKEKRYPDAFRLSEFPRGFDLSTLNLVIEVYKTEKTQNYQGENSMRTLSSGKNTRLVYTTSTNHVSFGAGSGTKSGSNNIGIYKVRLRNTITGVVTDFLETKLELRSFPVCETNASLSANNCVGYYKVMRLS